MIRNNKKDFFPQCGELLKGITTIDYKDTELLKKFMTEGGKMYPGRFTGVTAKQQRAVKNAVRRARVMGLLP
jgi:small subunit ribosomal protein S18